MTPDGEEEWLVDQILDECVQGKGHQYLVCWCGWGPKEDRWLPGHELADIEALDIWLHGGISYSWGECNGGAITTSRLWTDYIITPLYSIFGY